MASTTLSIRSVQVHKSKIRSSCRATHLRQATRHYYWASRFGKPYAGSHIYKQHTYSSRYIKYRPSSELQCSQNVKDAPSFLPSARLSSSWRNGNSPKSNEDEEWGKASQEAWKEAKEQWRDMREMMDKDSELSLKLLRDFIEKDQYKALLGSRELAWTPWKDFERWFGYAKSHNHWADTLVQDKQTAKGKDTPRSTRYWKEKSTSQASPEEWRSTDKGIRYEFDRVFGNGRKHSGREVSNETSKEQQPTKSNDVSHSSGSWMEKDNPQASRDEGCGIAKTSVLEEFTIDPITMRRVPKIQPKSDSSHSDASNLASASKLEDEAKTVPMKRFEPETMTDLNKQEIQALQPNTESADVKLSGFAVQPWLVKEGFTDNASRSAEVFEPQRNAHENRSGLTYSKIQPSLNRTAMSSGALTKPLECYISENRAEDLDLLRASDVRAASGHIKKKPQLSSEQAQERREILENSFAKAERNYANDMQFALEGLAESQIANTKRQETAPKDHIATAKDSEQLSHYSQLQCQMKLAAKLLKDARRSVADQMYAIKVEPQREAYDELENARCQQLSAVNQVFEGSQSLRDSVGPVDPEATARRRRDMDLVRQNLNINKAKHKSISGNHKQPMSDFTRGVEMPCVQKLSIPVPELEVSESETKTTPMKIEKSSEPSEPIPNLAVPKVDTATIAMEVPSLKEDIFPSSMKVDNGTSSSRNVDEPKPENPYLYSILALDRATSEVRCATTTSSIEEAISPIRSASSILTHLDKPWLYFKYMEVLEKEGYRLVSGNRGNLIYRKKLLDEMPSADINSASSVSDTTQSGEGYSDAENIARVLRPVREEPVFSGPPTPQERIIRAYQRANRAWPAIEEQLAARGQAGENSRHGARDSEGKTSRRNKVRRSLRGFLNKVGTVGVAVLVCYLVGLTHNNKIQRDADSKEKEKQIELERQMREKEKETVRRWF